MDPVARAMTSIAHGMPRNPLQTRDKNQLPTTRVKWSSKPRTASACVVKPVRAYLFVILERTLIFSAQDLHVLPNSVFGLFPFEALDYGA